MWFKVNRIIEKVYTQRCIDLANLAFGMASPNPMVGAVVVHHDKIIGEGYYRHFGDSHAEVHAIQMAKEKFPDLLTESTLYVSLEPCCFYGKTPACTDLILQSKIPKVVIGMKDPHPRVTGEGIKILKQAGVQVELSSMEDKCRFLNKRFITFHQKKRPYIILKWAQCKNGFLGEKDRRTAISGSLSNTWVHQWRSQEDAILVGSQTAITDNPQLTNRKWTGKNPKRIILSPNTQLPENTPLFDNNAETFIFSNVSNNYHGARTFPFTDLPSMMNSLYDLEIQSILIEGGAKTLQSFIDLNLWDEIRVLQSKEVSCENGVSAPKLAATYDSKKENDDDILFQYFTEKT